MSTFFKSCRRILQDMPTRLSAAGITSTDSCESCHINFNIIRKKRACGKCLRCFCTDCLLRRESICKSCSVLSTWPLHRPQLLQLRARDIKAFLTANGVSTHGCVEKEELVELALRYLGNRHQMPTYSPRRMSTRIVDDAWVLINDATGGGESTRSSASASQNVPARETTSQSVPSRSEMDGPSEATATKSVPANREASQASSESSGTDSDSSPTSEMGNEDAEMTDSADDNDVSDTTRVNESEPQQSTTSQPTPAISVPERRNLVNEGVSTSLPHISSIDENMDSENSLPNVSNFSESQPNLASQDEPSTSRSSRYRLAPRTSSSQLSMDNMSILAMSRTDLAALGEADLEGLSIKNLKVLLTKHRVDFRGCCEKEELLERTRRLQQQLQAQAKIDVGELSDENLCKVCMAAVIDCVLLDCGHLITCTPCGKQMSECPVCRQYVIRVVKTFRA